jgi:PAS domain S-box-containing protein
MIWTASGDGRINYVNKRFAENFVRNDADTVMESIRILIHPDDSLTAQRSWVKAIKERQDFRIQLRLKNKFGLFNWYLFKGIPLHDQKGKVNKWLGSCLNIHEHVTELERRDEFISIASHELKTPITSLNLTLQTLGGNKAGFTESQIKMIGQADRNAKRIKTLIDELLNVKRLTEGQLSLKRTRFNVSNMVHNCLSSFLAEGQHNLTVSVDTSLELEADEHRLEQVIVNFINNAIKYAHGSPIFIIAEAFDNKTKISVKDDGPGIAGEKIPHLFERYYRADHSGVEYSGLGLGLYICAEIVKRHGGQIGVDSKLGKGSDFWFVI